MFLEILSFFEIPMPRLLKFRNISNPPFIKTPPPFIRHLRVRKNFALWNNSLHEILLLDCFDMLVLL